MISIFDYGAGNLRSVQNTLTEIGATYKLIDDAAGLREATNVARARRAETRNWP